MKEFSDNKEFWKDKAYFSIDAFFTDEQSKDLIEMLKEVKLKAKQFSNENDKLGITGMKIRRFKFYDNVLDACNFCSYIHTIERKSIFKNL
ncbi:MAG: hypothetical protein ACXVLQ_13340 [Bacteriovorax sp.]